MIGNVMLGCLMVMIVFMTVGFPELLAKITFFSYINRMDLAYGFVATLFTIWGIDMIWKKRIFTKWQILWSLVAYTALNICFVGERELTYLEWWQYAIIIAGLTALAYLMLKGHKTLFLTGMTLLIIISSFTINPLSHGVSALFNHPLEQKINEIVKKNPDARWLAINERLLASIGVANGAKMLNMVNFYPDYGKWQIVDPDGEYDDIYNRYAHINATLTEEETKFTEGATADVFNVELSCKDAKKLNVHYLVVASKLTKCMNDFEEIYKDSEGEYYIYERESDE